MCLLSALSALDSPLFHELMLVNQLGDLEKVSVRCGGLPQNPKPPLDYMLVFSVAGLTNEYFGPDLSDLISDPIMFPFVRHPAHSRPHRPRRCFARRQARHCADIHRA